MILTCFVAVKGVMHLHYCQEVKYAYWN